jgi:hypothetical protein
MAPDDWEARTSLVEEEDDEEVMAQEDGGARMRTCVALQGRLPSSGGLEHMARVAAGSQAAARRRKGGGGGGDLKKTRQRRPVRDPWGGAWLAAAGAQVRSAAAWCGWAAEREGRKPKIDSLDS